MDDGLILKFFKQRFKFILPIPKIDLILYVNEPVVEVVEEEPEPEEEEGEGEEEAWL